MPPTVKGARGNISGWDGEERLSLGEVKVVIEEETSKGQQ